MQRPAVDCRAGSYLEKVQMRSALTSASASASAVANFLGTDQLSPRQPSFLANTSYCVGIWSVLPTNGESFDDPSRTRVAEPANETTRWPDCQHLAQFDVGLGTLLITSDAVLVYTFDFFFFFFLNINGWNALCFWMPAAVCDPSACTIATVPLSLSKQKRCRTRDMIDNLR